MTDGLDELRELRKAWEADMRANAERMASAGDTIAAVGERVAALVTRMTDQHGPDTLAVLYNTAARAEELMLDGLTERAGLVWVCQGDGSRNAHDAEECEQCGQARPWPRRLLDGRTVWACCVSSIGPKCRHVAGTP